MLGNPKEITAAPIGSNIQNHGKSIPCLRTQGLFKIEIRATEDLLGLLNFGYSVRLTDYTYPKQIHKVISISTKANVIPK